MKRSLLALSSALALLASSAFAGEGKKDQKTADCATTCPACCGGCETTKVTAAADADQQESAKVAATAKPAEAGAKKS